MHHERGKRAQRNPSKEMFKECAAERSDSNGGRRKMAEAIKMGGPELEPGELFFLAPSLENGTNSCSRRHTRTVPTALPTKVFHNRKTGRGSTEDEKCRMCRKATESVSHILAGCGALALRKYLSQLNNALKILFFEEIRSLDLISAVEPW